MTEKNSFLMRRSIRTLIAMLLWASFCIPAVEATCIEGNKKISLPLNSVEGRLPNGIHYIILPNTTPVHTTDFRLVMKVGSVQEEENQKGAAHFLEHMAFAGTENFPDRSLVEYFESLGMKYGRDINAVTGYDRTVFMLTIPMSKEDKQITDKTLLSIKEWLTNISFDEKRIKKEQGVILEELRGYDCGDEFYSLKIGKNRFSERLPLGNNDDIRSIDRNKLIEFYRKWYAPQLASIVVVGCIDPIYTEKQIIKMFSDIAPKTLASHRTYPLTYPHGVSIQESKDTLLYNSELEVIIPHPCVVGRDLTSAYRKELGKFLVRLIGSRFNMRDIKVNVSDEWYLSETNHFVLSFSAKDKELLISTLTRLSSELHDIIRNGFCSQEIDAKLHSFIEDMQVNSQERNSSLWCDDFIDYIITGEKYIYNEEEMEYLRKKISHVRSGELQSLLQEWLEFQSQHMLIAYRNNSSQNKSLTTDEVVTAWEKGKELIVDQFVYPQREDFNIHIHTPSCLTDNHEFNSKQIRNEFYHSNMGIHETILENGIRIILKPTTNNNEHLLFTAIGRGGIADLPINEYHRLEGTAGYMEMGGIAAVDYDTLSSYMSQEEMSLNLFISNYWHEIMGMAPVKRAQELFNLIFEKIYRPELCYQSFEEIKEEEVKNINKETLLEQMIKRSPERIVSNRLDSLVGNIPAKGIKPCTIDDIKSLNLDYIASYYRNLFGNPQGLTMIVTGNFKPEELKKQLSATFSRMKSPGIYIPYKNVYASLPKGKYIEAFANDAETQTILQYIFAGNYKPSLKEHLKMKLIRDILQARLLKLLREERNIAYSPYVSLHYNGVPQGIFYFNLSASVEMGNTKQAEDLILRIIKELQETPVSNKELQTMKHSFLVTKKQVLSDDAATEWRNTLVNQLKNGESLTDFEHYEKCLEEITPLDLKEFVCKYIDTKRFILLYQGKHINY